MKEKEQRRFHHRGTEVRKVMLGRMVAPGGEGGFFYGVQVGFGEEECRDKKENESVCVKHEKDCRRK